MAEKFNHQNSIDRKKNQKKTLKVSQPCLSLCIFEAIFVRQI